MSSGEAKRQSSSPRTSAPSLYPDKEPQTVVELRDRAILGVMLYSFARVGALVRMQVSEYEEKGQRRAFLRLQEKGGQFNRVPVHHKAGEFLEAYLDAAELTEGPLWRTSRGRSGKLTERTMAAGDVWRMVKRRAADAGIHLSVTCHSFRASGITAYLSNGGSLETAAGIAGHASTRTTQLYDRRQKEISLDEIERIVI